jgi:guanine deaminase
MQKIVLGSFLNPVSDKKCQVVLNGAMVIKYKKNGSFAAVDYLGDVNKAVKKYKDFDETIDLRDKLIMPGFFDMHFHWVQDDVREMPKDSLLTWLEKYTFPAENKFKDKKYAKEKAQKFFKKLTQNGTLGGACYSSIHGHALDYAFKYAVGDFVIGNVLMTMNSPKYLTQKKSQAIKLANKMSEKYKEKYALTPRFAIATDPETMSETSKVAKKNKSFLQTHLSENKDEIAFVKSLYQSMPKFKKIKSYTEIYKKTGILSSKTIMGHAIHLEKDELEMLSKSKTAIAHCPTSNAPHKELGLESGLFDFKKIEKAKIRWALASDIGGGPFLSMFDVMRSFVEQNTKAKVKGASYVKALNRATNSGAQILKVDKKKGNFEVGKQANFIAVDFPKLSQKTKDAELILKKVINIHKNDRKNYQSLVKSVFYNGEKLD